MRFDKKLLNISLLFISLIVVVFFTTLYYIPKYNSYKETSEKVSSIQKDYQQRQIETSKLEELKDLLSKYQTEIDKIKGEKENTREFSDSKLFITLENLSDRTKVDLAISNSGSPLNSPNNEEDDSDKDKDEGDESKVSEDEEDSDESERYEDNSNSSNYSYNLELRGEYRSIMVFLFELRNLEYTPKISDFNLIYNEDDDSKNDGFPLTAKFKISFGTDEDNENRYERSELD